MEAKTAHSRLTRTRTSGSLLRLLLQIESGSTTSLPLCLRQGSRGPIARQSCSRPSSISWLKLWKKEVILWVKEFQQTQATINQSSWTSRLKGSLMEAATSLVLLNRQSLVRIGKPTSFKGQPQTLIQPQIFTLTRLVPGPKMVDQQQRTVVLSTEQRPLLFATEFKLTCRCARLSQTTFKTTSSGTASRTLQSRGPMRQKARIITAVGHRIKLMRDLISLQEIRLKWISALKRLAVHRLQTSIFTTDIVKGETKTQPELSHWAQIVIALNTRAQALTTSLRAQATTLVQAKESLTTTRSENR